MSPRRSSRARTSQPNASLQQQSNSSSSSTTSGRADRGARTTQKAVSPRSSIATRSLSSEEIEGTLKPLPRRTRSSQEEKNDDILIRQGEDDEEGEEEITRCICGNLDYPGMPLPPGDRSKSGSKNIGESGLTGSPNMPPEDAGGLFIQCDVCKVWQHGGCVGIMEEAMSPEEYFCERCRKDLHKITTSVNGYVRPYRFVTMTDNLLSRQRYSRYLPVQESPSSKSSPTPPLNESASKKATERRSSRANPEPQASKRRATMNSRDSAYEAEQLRRAIEESKKEVGADGTEGGGRKGKRSRSDSEQYVAKRDLNDVADHDSNPRRKEDTKRQRTTFSSSPSDGKTILAETMSDDGDDDSVKPQEGPKKIRGAAARNHRNKELREQEEKREQDRAEAAGRRKARSERRKADGQYILVQFKSVNLNVRSRFRAFARTTIPHRY